MTDSLKGWRRSTTKTTPLPQQWGKFRHLVFSGKLSEELMAAYNYVRELPKMVPAGRRCATRELADVRKLIADDAEGAMFSATLTQLYLQERALSTIDCGRIAYIIETADTDERLRNMMGVITVNIGEGEQLSFIRANKDAEVDALCLLISWHSSNPQVHSQLIALASDLVLLGRCSGAA